MARVSSVVLPSRQPWLRTGSEEMDFDRRKVSVRSCEKSLTTASTAYTAPVSEVAVIKEHETSCHDRDDF